MKVGGERYTSDYPTVGPGIVSEHTAFLCETKGLLSFMDCFNV